MSLSLLFNYALVLKMSMIPFESRWEAGKGFESNMESERGRMFLSIVPQKSKEFQIVILIYDGEYLDIHKTTLSFQVSIEEGEYDEAEKTFHFNNVTHR